MRRSSDNAIFRYGYSDVAMGAAVRFEDRIGRRIKLQDLHILMAIVQAGSMSKGAALLNTTQSAISRSITYLEHTVGVRLLERNPQGVVPTLYGRELLKCGAAVFDDLRQGLKSIEFLADPTAGEVRIGSHYFLASSFVPAVIDRLSRHHPRIVFHAVGAQTDTLHRQLSEREIDLAIAWRFGSFEDEQLEFEHLYDDPHVVAAGAQNIWARQRKVRLNDLVDELWTLPPPDSVLGAIALGAFHACGLDVPRATVFSVAHETRVSLLSTGRFLTICSTSALRFPVKQTKVKALSLKLQMPRVPIGIVTLKGRTLSPATQLFINSARELAKTPAKRKRAPSEV